MRAFRKPQSAVFPGEDGTINRPEASSQIRISEERSGMRVVSVSADTFVNRKEWETAYSLELIEHILRVKGPAWLCDEIMTQVSGFRMMENRFITDITRIRAAW